MPIPQHARSPNVSLKYKDLVGSTNREIKKPIAVAYTADRNEMLASINRGVKKNLLGFETGEALTQAATLLNQGRVDEAIQRVDARMTVLGVAAQAWHDKDLDQDGKLLDRYKSVLGHLGRDRQLAQGECGQYLTRSLTYNGYQMTR